MLKTLLKLSATLALLIVLTASSVMASGKMEVKMGDKVTLQAENLTGGSLKWVAKRGKEILTTQSTSIFNYTFNQQGEFDVTLTITDNQGNTKSTTVLVLVGERYAEVTGTAVGEGDEGGLAGTPLSVGLETLPAKTSQRSVHILGDEGRVVFDMATRDDILEYRIDRNVFVDSDGNGIANDDIDNDDHSSYLLGGTWQTKYLASESNKIAAEVTVVNKEGRKAKTQVEIIFEPVPSKEGSVVAVLDTLPAMSAEDKTIYVYDELDTVAFYTRRSQGDVVEYRIDKNIFVDSNGDGNPSNDIDNKNDNSFRTGDVWTTAYEKTDDQIIAQLIAVGRGGTGSRIQRAIKFTDKPDEHIPEATGSDSPIQLMADKEFVQKGDPINFSVDGLLQDIKNYVFEWDFNGDGEVDQTVEGENTVSYIYDDPGIPQTKVRVIDLDGNEATFLLDVLVKDIAETTADFEYIVDGNKVSFTNGSVVSPNLTSKVLTYNWSFGDTDENSYEAQKDQIGVQNPTYTYTKLGTYIVTLTVVDSDQVSSTKTEEIVIEEVLGEDGMPIVEGEEEIKKPKGEGGSLIWTIVKGVFYVILVILFLILLIVVGLLAFLKIQHPDLVFEELIDELKIKILGMMGVHEEIEPEAGAESALAEVAPPEPAQEPVEAPAPEVEPEPVPEAPAEEPELAKNDAPVPDWLKNSGTEAPAPSEPAQEPQVIEGEVVETPIPEAMPTEPAPFTPDPAPVPETPAPAPEPTPAPEPEAPAAPAAPAEEPPAEPAAEGGGEDLKKNDGPVPDWLKNA